MALAIGQQLTSEERLERSVFKIHGIIFCFLLTVRISVNFKKIHGSHGMACFDWYAKIFYSILLNNKEKQKWLIMILLPLSLLDWDQAELQKRFFRLSMAARRY